MPQGAGWANGDEVWRKMMSVKRARLKTLDLISGMLANNNPDSLNEAEKEIIDALAILWYITEFYEMIDATPDDNDNVSRDIRDQGLREIYKIIKDEE
jgi:hypothetical protein